MNKKRPSIPIFYLFFLICSKFCSVQHDHSSNGEVFHGSIFTTYKNAFLDINKNN